MKHPIESYQDALLPEGELRGVRECAKRFALIEPHLPEAPAVLDLGSNFGYFTRRIKEAREDAVVLSVEANPQACEVQRRVLEGLEGVALIQGRLGKRFLGLLRSTPEHFDVVLLLSVLHHLEPHELRAACLVLDELAPMVVLEVPEPEDAEACGGATTQAIHALGIEALFPNKEFTAIGTGESHLNDRDRTIYVGRNRSPFVSRGTRAYVGSTVERRYTCRNKVLTVDASADSSIRVGPWIPGFNLYSWSRLGAVVSPDPATLLQQIQVGFEALPATATDLRPWNLIYTARGVQFIDTSSDSEAAWCNYDPEDLARLQSWIRSATALPSSPASSRDQPIALVFCERVENQNVCGSILRELGERYEVRVFGPGWEAEDWESLEIAQDRIAFYLELDAVTGAFHRPERLERLNCPKFAWLIDTHKKTGFHQSIARDVDLTFYAMKNWGHVFDRPAQWLPVHFDQRLFVPRDCEREFDIAFVGSHAWRAEPLQRIAAKHDLRLHMSCTSGRREKSETSRIYAKSKLVFNQHVANDLNFRVVEAMGCGRVLLSDAQPNGQEDLFKDGEHYSLYQNEAELERLILMYLGDDAARQAVEARAAQHAHGEHSTRARVSELLARIEAWCSARATDAGRAEPAKRRWIVCAGSVPNTVEGLSYAESLARELFDQGHEVVIARRSRHALPQPAPQPGEGPKTIELDAGPLPNPTQSEWLLETGPHLIRLDRIVEDHGPFDVVLGEGHEGGLLGASFAERLGLPLVVALASVEVHKRGNRLTREQLYYAELEDWACARASVVLTADLDTQEAARDHYGQDSLLCPWPRARVCRVAPEAATRYLTALDLDHYVVALDGVEGAEPTVTLGDQVCLVEAHEEARTLSPDPVCGSPLAALLQGACRVEGQNRHDRRLHEAAILRGEAPVACPVSTKDALSALCSRLGNTRRAPRRAHALL